MKTPRRSDRRRRIGVLILSYHIVLLHGLFRAGGAGRNASGGNKPNETPSPIASVSP